MRSSGSASAGAPSSTSLRSHGCASTAGLVAAVTIAFVGEFRVPLRLGYLTAASIWNADIAQYAGVSTGLVAHGFGWAGNIAGVDLGHWATDARGIGPGVYAALAAVAASTGLGTWQVALPLLLVGVGLGALAVRDTARALLPDSLVAAPVIALLATTASLFGYITTNYFLAQVLVMPLVLGELVVLFWIVRRPTWRERTAGLTLLAAIVIVATLSYSPMAFAMQPVIVGAVCLGEAGRGWLRRSGEVVGATIGAFGVAFVLAPEPFLRSARYVHVALTTKRGWPLGLMTPVDILGFRQVIRVPRPSVGVFLFESVLLGMIVVGAVWALWNERRRAAMLRSSRHAPRADVVRGGVCPAWLFVRTMEVDLVLRARVHRPRCSRWSLLPALRSCAGGYPRPARVGRSARYSAVVLLATSARTLVYRDPVHEGGVGRRCTRHCDGASSSRRCRSSRERPDLADAKAVNINLPQWDEMWAAYFLQPARARLSPRPELFPGEQPSSAVVDRAGARPVGADRLSLRDRANAAAEVAARRRDQVATLNARQAWPAPRKRCWPAGPSLPAT